MSIHGIEIFEFEGILPRFKFCIDEVLIFFQRWEHLIVVFDNVVVRDERLRSVFLKERVFSNDGGEFVVQVRRRRDKVRGGDDFGELGGRHVIFRVFDVVQ